MKKYIVAFVLLASVFLKSCSNELDILAPYKSYLTVFAILNPQDSVHYIRIAKVFQTDGNALEYASKNDLSVKNANVYLSDGQNKIVFVPDTITKSSGEFYSEYVVYKSTAQLEAGKTYTLFVGARDEENGDSLVVTGKTTIPSAPYIITPDSIEAGSGNTQAYPTLAFEKDINIEFYAYDFRLPQKSEAAAYELRIYFDYSVFNPTDSTITPQKTLRFGPTSLFTGKETRCNAPLCYRLGAKTFVQYLKSQLNDPNKVYVYDDGQRSQALKVELTSVDEYLYKYLVVSDPAFNDFLEVRPRYTNLTLKRYTGEGNEEEEGIGIFGSINTAFRYVRMSVCSQYLVGLNQIVSPPPNCE